MITYCNATLLSSYSLMLDTIKIKTTKAKIIKPIRVQDIYNHFYDVLPNNWISMPANEKRFIKSGDHIERTGRYYPSLTFRPFGELFIEFSAPKIAFDTNLFELADDDTELFINNLRAVLLDMGVQISVNDLWNSEISNATVSKNVLVNEITALEFIEFTRRLWWRWRSNIKIESYKNEGISLREYSETTAIGIYAKVPSLSAIKHKTNTEKHLAENLQTNNILRFEYRMQNYQRTVSKYSWAMNKYMKKLTLRDIFNSALSKKILLFDLDKNLFSNEFKMLSIKVPTIQKLYDYLSKQKLKPSEEMALIAYWRLCSDIGTDKANILYQGRYSKSTTLRIKKLMDRVSNGFMDYDHSQARKEIYDAFNTFFPLNQESLLPFLRKHKQSEEQLQISTITP